MTSVPLAMHRSTLATKASSLSLRWKSSAVGEALQVALGSAQSPSEMEEAVDPAWARARPYSQMPGPPPLPLLGNTWRFLPVFGDYRIAEVDRVVQRLHAQYGRVVKLAGLLGRPDMVFLFDPDDIERVFRSEDAAPHRPSMPSLDYYKHVLRKDFFGEHPGVIAVHGEKWLQFRSRVQQVMLQPRTARQYVRPIEESADAFVRRARSLKKLSGDEQLVPADFMNEIHKWSLESIARVALDARLGCLEDDAHPDTQRLIDAVTTFFHHVGVLELKAPFWRVVSTPTWRQFIRALDVITELTSRYIEEALQRFREQKRRVDSGGAEGAASLLERVLAQNDDPRVACVLALDMFLVGIDTTSTAVASVLYQLALHPEVQQRLHEEVQRELPARGYPLTPEHLERMTYLRAVIKETLRMYPVVIGNGRTVTKDTVIAGYQIPKGTQLVFQHYVISNKERYFPSASRFLPERWLRSVGGGSAAEGNNNCPASHKVHPFASLPFGFGRRMCLGRRFADLEIQTVVAKVVQAFRLEWPHERLQYRIHPMYTPDGPLRFRLVDRRQRSL